MKLSIFTLGILVASAGFVTRAEAQNYPWCAYYGGPAGGTNCGFISFDQCMETLRGMGGMCNVNTQYVPPPGPHASPGKAKTTSRKVS